MALTSFFLYVTCMEVTRMGGYTEWPALFTHKCGWLISVSAESEAFCHVCAMWESMKTN